jgi:hypothetical protein
MHKRAQIRAAIVDLLIAANTAASSRVYGNRAMPLWDLSLPAVLVYARDEDSKPQGVSDQSLIRTMRVSIQAVSAANDTLDDDLDVLAGQIEAAMNADDNLGTLVISSTLISTELDVAADGEKPIGAVRMTYEIRYAT